MRLFFKAKDGGPDSSVTGYWLIESKKFFSIVLLKFDGRSREAYHTHAFNAWSWILPSGLGMMEYLEDGSSKFLKPDSLVFTPRDRMHKVDSNGTTWVLSFRGPWLDNWKEINEHGHQTLTHGRKVMDT
jgi:mannose-6-phosphate isomerase-like protein (cupin superfamily)